MDGHDAPLRREFPASLLAVRTVLGAGGRLTRVTARRSGLGESELLALEVLAQDSVGPADLARRLGISTAAATGVVDRLAERGHVVRDPDELDRRRVAVRLTDSGYADLRARLAVTFDALLAWDAGFDESDRELVTRYLDGVIEALERAAARETSGGG